MGTTHKAALEAVRLFCRRTGGVCYVLHQVGRLRGSAGLPDCYCLWPRLGVSAWVEVKPPGAKPTNAQMAFAHAARDCGQTVLCGGASELYDWLKPRLEEAHGD